MAALEATTLSPTLLADSPNMQLLVTGLCLAATLLVGAIVIALSSRWRRRHNVAEDLSPGGQLAHFRSLYEAGTISQEEFERLRALLGGQLRKEMGVPAPAPEGSTPVPPGPNGQGSQEPPTGIRPA